MGAQIKFEGHMFSFRSLRTTTNTHLTETTRHRGSHDGAADQRDLKYNIPYNQVFRLRRICSSNDLLEQRIMEYSNFLSLAATKVIEF